MKDLDFDELDKAVNSLMGGVKDKDATAASKTLDVNTTLAPDEKPVYDRLGQVAGKIGSEAIDHQEQTVSLEDTPAETPLMIVPESLKVTKPQQKAGRFMDVVHPSSDMKRPMLSKVSREGVTIAAPERPAVKVEDRPAERSEATPAPALETTSGSLPPTNAPDHIPAPPPVVEETIEAASPEEVPVPVTEPLTSPFLADAKVEKRPLGGEPLTGVTPPVAEASAMAPANVEPIPVAPAPAPIADAKADDSSVMDTITDPAKTEEDATVHIPEEYQDALLEVEKGSIDPLATDQQNLSESSADIPAAAMTIPKQYQEKPSTGETDSGAIFDTDHYHKPLAHPPAKKSGWLWIVGIIVFIILGAAAGAAFYFISL